MADSKCLSAEQVQTFLAELPGWTYSSDQLHKTFKFADFGEALGFMIRVGMVCEKLNHHPNWYNVYNRVDVQLWTHSAGGVTGLDIKLATAMSEIAA